MLSFSPSMNRISRGYCVSQIETHCSIFNIQMLSSRNLRALPPPSIAHKYNLHVQHITMKFLIYIRSGDSWATWCHCSAFSVDDGPPTLLEIDTAGLVSVVSVLVFMSWSSFVESPRPAVVTTKFANLAHANSKLSRRCTKLLCNCCLLVLFPPLFGLFPLLCSSEWTVNVLDHHLTSFYPITGSSGTINLTQSSQEGLPESSTWSQKISVFQLFSNNNSGSLGSYSCM